jgi:ABC-type uncharacterized transport system ATPase subunit
MVILTVDKHTKYYADITAVDNISFEVNKGELLGFLGVNGAGKFTTINILSTLMKPTSGSTMVCGYTICNSLGRAETPLLKQIELLDFKRILCPAAINPKDIILVSSPYTIYFVLYFFMRFCFSI